MVFLVGLKPPHRTPPPRKKTKTIQISRITPRLPVFFINSLMYWNESFILQICLIQNQSCSMLQLEMKRIQLHWNNSLQITCSTLTHYTDSTETTVYRYLAPFWHIILIPLKQQSTDILLHSDTLYRFHWNNSLQISCSTRTYYTDSTETTVYRYLVPLLTHYADSTETSLQISCSTLDTLYWFHWNNSLQISCSTKQQSTDILLHSDTLYWLHWNNSLQISCSTLTHYTDSTETSLQISWSTLTHYTDSTETTVYIYLVPLWHIILIPLKQVYRYLAPLWHIILIPLKQQSTDILFHSDTLYWLHWNNSLQISCSTLTHYTDSTETTVYRYLAPLWHIILTPLKQQSTDILLYSNTLYWLHWNNSLQISCSTLTHYTDSQPTSLCPSGLSGDDCLIFSQSEPRLAHDGYLFHAGARPNEEFMEDLYILFELSYKLFGLVVSENIITFSSNQSQELQCFLPNLTRRNVL